MAAKQHCLAVRRVLRSIWSQREPKSLPQRAAPRSPALAHPQSPQRPAKGLLPVRSAGRKIRGCTYQKLRAQTHKSCGEANFDPQPFCLAPPNLFAPRPPSTAADAAQGKASCTPRGCREVAREVTRRSRECPRAR